MWLTVMVNKWNTSQQPALIKLHTVREEQGQHRTDSANIAGLCVHRAEMEKLKDWTRPNWTTEIRNHPFPKKHFGQEPSSFYQNCFPNDFPDSRTAKHYPTFKHFRISFAIPSFYKWSPVKLFSFLNHYVKRSVYKTKNQPVSDKP